MNHPKRDNELLSEFNPLITTIITRIVNPCLINNVIANFCLFPPSPITLRFVFLEQLQSLFYITASNTIKTYYSRPLGLTLCCLWLLMFMGTKCIILFSKICLILVWFKCPCRFITRDIGWQYLLIISNDSYLAANKHLFYSKKWYLVKDLKHENN